MEFLTTTQTLTKRDHRHRLPHPEKDFQHIMNMIFQKNQGEFTCSQTKLTHTEKASLYINGINWNSIQQMDKTKQTWMPVSLWKERKDTSAVSSSCRMEGSGSNNFTALPSVPNFSYLKIIKKPTETSLFFTSLDYVWTYSEQIRKNKIITAQE